MELNEVVQLLKENDFNYIDLDDDPTALDRYYTAGQLMYNINQPIDIKILYEALQGIGVIRFYEGHQIPNSPDFTAFTVIKDQDENDKILILYNPSILDELLSVLNENEFFLKFMADENQKQMNLIQESKKLTSIAIDTTGGSFKTDKIITIALVSIENGIKKEAIIWVDNNWNDVDIKRYTTPKIQGKKSTFDFLNIPLPGMSGSLNHPFIDIRKALRIVYAYTNKSCLIVEKKGTIDFVKALFDSQGINENHHIDNNIKGYVELSRVAKMQQSEYMTIKEMQEFYGVREKTNYYASGKSIKQMAIAQSMIRFK